MRPRGLAAMVMALTAIGAMGCATSRVNFSGPADAKLLLIKEHQSYTLPAVLDLTRRDSLDRQFENRGGRPIRLDLADGTELIGYLYVYRLRMDQVEELAEVSFDLTEEQIGKLKSGAAVTVVGYTPRKQPVYKINLGLVRE